MRSLATGIIILVLSCISQAATTTSAGFTPLTTVFTPAPECTSLTIVHIKRNVAVYTGCVGVDPSCCPPKGQRNSIYSPGICPKGYVTHDAHVGLDHLGTDTVTWEASCVPSGVTTCTRPWYISPVHPGLYCPRPYTSALPNLTTPITASVYYYNPANLANDDLAWPGTPEFRTTTVLSGSSWPTLTPDSTTPTAIYVSELVIRWQEKEFSKGSTGLVYLTPTGKTKHSTATRASGRGSTSRGSKSTSTSSPDDSDSPKFHGKNKKSILPSVLSGILVLSFIAFVILIYRSRRKKSSPTGIELDNRFPTGCEILYEGPPFTDSEPQSPTPNPEIDIIFVHGLRGHPTKTWTKDNCCWPKDLLPKFLPNSRIITYGYDARVARLVGRVSSNTIDHHSDDLLLDLERITKSAGTSDRPILFIAHSLGGLVVKDCLYKARKERSGPWANRVYSNTTGIIFLGTPHRGSGYASFGRRVADILQFVARDTNVPLLRSMEVDSQVLRWISKEFLETMDRRPPIRVFSFTEELAMAGFLKPVVGGLSGFMGIEGERRATLNRDHRDIARFYGEGDGAFRRVLGVVLEFAGVEGGGGMESDAEEGVEGRGSGGDLVELDGDVGVEELDIGEVRYRDFDVPYRDV